MAEIEGDWVGGLWALYRERFVERFRELWEADHPAGLEVMAWAEGDDEAVWAERAAAMVGPLTELVEALLTMHLTSALESELASRAPEAEWARVAVIGAALGLVPLIAERWALRTARLVESPLFEDGVACGRCTASGSWSGSGSCGRPTIRPASGDDDEEVDR